MFMIFAVVASLVLTNALNGRSLNAFAPADPRESNHEYLASSGPACGKFLTAAEKRDFKDLSQADAERIGRASCQQMTWLLAHHEPAGEMRAGSEPEPPMPAAVRAPQPPTSKSGPFDCRLALMERDVFETLTHRHQLAIALMGTDSERMCSLTKKALRELARIPRDMRDEQVDGLIDAVVSR